MKLEVNLPFLFTAFINGACYIGLPRRCNWQGRVSWQTACFPKSLILKKNELKSYFNWLGCNTGTFLYFAYRFMLGNDKVFSVSLAQMDFLGCYPSNQCNVILSHWAEKNNGVVAHRSSPPPLCHITTPSTFSFLRLTWHHEQPFLAATSSLTCVIFANCYPQRGCFAVGERCVITEDSHCHRDIQCKRKHWSPVLNQQVAYSLP